MKGASWKAARLGAAAAALALAQPAAAEDGLALRRLLLSSGGVGYFEYEARVQGDADLPLTVRLDQVDDVLKSIVIYDDAGGAGEVTLASITGGVLRITSSARHTTDVTIAGAAREPRTVILEEPRLAGYTLTAPEDAAVEVAPDRYRIRVEVPEGRTVTLAVTQESPVEQRITLADLPGTGIAPYAAMGEIPPAVREALGRIAVRGAEAEVTRITAEQARIRENLKVVPADAPLHQRYLVTLAQQEDRLAAIDAQREAAKKDLDAARRALDAAIRDLSV